MSNICVSVQWKNSTVFAGEDIECTITFKNTALARCIPRSLSPNSHAAGHGSHRERWKESLHATNDALNMKHRELPCLTRLSQSHARSHQQPSWTGSANGFPKSPAVDAYDGIPNTASLGNNKHRRSVSIVSIRGEINNETSLHGQLMQSGRSGHTHARATSLHIMPRKKGFLSNGSSPGTCHSLYSTMC